MAEEKTEPKLLLPALNHSRRGDTVMWLVIRVAVGWNLLVHGWGKIMIGSTDGFLKAFADMGFTPPAFWLWGSTAIEFLSGSCSFGSFTALRRRRGDRMLFIFVHLLGGRQRLRLAQARPRIRAAVGLVLLCHCVRGGGPYLLDRKIGREL